MDRRTRDTTGALCGRLAWPRPLWGDSAQHILHTLESSTHLAIYTKCTVSIYLHPTV